MTPDNLQACSMEAAAAILAGNRLIARLNVENAIGENQNCVDSWLLYAWTSDSPSAAKLAIDRALEVDPDHELALAGQSWIQGVTSLANDWATQDESETPEAVAETEAGLSELIDSIAQEQQIVDASDDPSPVGDDSDEVTSEMVADQECDTEDDGETCVEAEAAAGDIDADEIDADASSDSTVDATTNETEETDAIVAAGDSDEDSCSVEAQLAPEAEVETDAAAEVDEDSLTAELQHDVSDEDAANAVADSNADEVCESDEDGSCLATAECEADESDEVELESEAEPTAVTKPIVRREIAPTLVADELGSFDFVKPVVAADQTDASDLEASFTEPELEASHEAPEAAIELDGTSEEETVAEPAEELAAEVVVGPESKEAELVDDVRNSLQESLDGLAAHAVESVDTVETPPAAKPVRVRAETIEITSLDEPAAQPAPAKSATSELLEAQIAAQVSEISETVSDAVQPAAAPAAEVVAQPPVAESPVNETPVNESLPVVMIVDDSPTIRKLVSMTLGRNGFEVIAANDGVDALKLLSEQRPDIILSDISMPRLGGYQLCKFVKKHARTKLIPVLMLSGKDGVFDKMRGKMAGANGYITKPFESADLVHQVRQQLLSAAVG